MFHAARRSVVRSLKEGVAVYRLAPVSKRRVSSQAAGVLHTYSEAGPSRPKRQHSDNRRRPNYDGPRYTLTPNDDIITLNYHLSRAAQSLNFVQTFDLLSVIRRRGMSPTLETYHSLLFVLAQNELAEEALAILADMEGVGLRPDIHAFNLVLQAAIPHPQAHAHARTLMKTALVLPNEETYELILGQWVEQSNLEMCLQDLQNMFDTGVAPTMASMTKVINLAADMGRPRLALDLISAYEAGEVERLPTSVWLHLLTSSVEEFFDEGVERALQKCEKVALDEGILMDILHFATRRSNLPLLQKILEDLKSNGVKLQEHHYAPLVELHSAEKNFTDALAVFGTMRQNDITPTPGSARSLYEALAKDWDNIDRTYRIIEAMRDRDEKIHLVVLNALLQAAMAKKDLHRAVGFYHGFSSFGVSPDATTLTLLLRNCSNSDNGMLAHELWDEIVAGGVRPDEKAYNAMIHSTSLSMTDYEACFHWLEEMKSKGFTPSKALYEMLVKRLAYRNDPRLQTALEEMQEQGYEMSGAVRRFVEHGGRIDKTPPKEEGESLLRRNHRLIHDKRRQFPLDLDSIEARQELYEEERSRSE
ncbi:hypothetical protein FRB96_008776 [Tulasnella sp. 330]|nr:hypothetical protein FRB96_008776 [Tulasnella sp. 330]KAG8884131.1 hypothetical protein FRB97_005114 [Tulasnella sp. 331]KAG8890194.1 hypothetical protein FRB98_000522 [Tulasnella sp. 332]